MTTDEILEIIKNKKPKLVYISGKTSTGKSTFSKNLRDLYGYSIIDLGEIVFKSVIEPFSADPAEAFITAYRDTEPKEYVNAFIRATKDAILSKLDFSPVVVEGAIAKSRILKEIFSGEIGDFMFIYFHPINHDKYAQRIKQRFMNGAENNTTDLPKLFWFFIDQSDLEKFIKTKIFSKELNEAINRYASISMEESKERLKHFQKNFAEINIIEI